MMINYYLSGLPTMITGWVRVTATATAATAATADTTGTVGTTPATAADTDTAGIMDTASTIPLMDTAGDIRAASRRNDPWFWRCNDQGLAPG